MIGQIFLNRNNFIYELLMDSRYRILRHVILIILILIVSVNNTISTVNPMDHIQLGSIYFLLSLALVYINLFILIPKFLFNRKFFKYVLLLSVTIIILQNLLKLVDGIFNNYFFDNSEFTVFIQVISEIGSFLVNFISLLALSMTVVLRQWLLEKKQVTELEGKKIESDIEQLKEQINPHFLFNILNRMGEWAKIKPEKVSQMILKLSQILRYQLYDCSRDKVFLRSEINFLKNYLDLEKLYSNHFEYNISIEGDISRATVPPLIFNPFIRNLVLNKKNSKINITFEANKNNLVFTCNHPILDSLENFEQSKILQRLDLIYRNKYNLVFEEQSDKFSLILNY